MLQWAKQDECLLAMSNEVDYDQDGKFNSINLNNF